MTPSRKIGAEAGASFGGHAAVTGEVKIQYKGELTVGVSLDLHPVPGKRPPHNKPSLAVFADPSFAYARGVSIEIQKGVSVALGIDVTIDSPGARVTGTLEAGKNIKDGKVESVNPPVCVSSE
jgi:hypothetical protein